MRKKVFEKSECGGKKGVRKNGEGSDGSAEPVKNAERL